MAPKWIPLSGESSVEAIAGAMCKERQSSSYVTKRVLIIDEQPTVVKTKFTKPMC
jgi:hypothetical protein